ncbi:SDR family NAD(P)-dependent oxidoreductase [Rhodococcoides kroppenstedtii]|uniref:SDR family NAD(P)-dependent oxidoreductase n=1 Tax=Rhodococcoides kroppenstedtii TaxID=293050 RepID=UPI0035304920
MDGVDLTGKVAVVTGGYSGLGLHTTIALVRAGARVLVPARRGAVARAVLDGIDDVQVVGMDLADQDSCSDLTRCSQAVSRVMGGCPPRAEWPRRVL